MGWNSFQDLWALGVARRGPPASDAALLVKRAGESLFIWRRQSKGPLVGCGSFDLDMPEGCFFFGPFSHLATLPAEGEVGDPCTGGNVGPVALRWVTLDLQATPIKVFDDQARPIKTFGYDVVVPDWPVFEDQSTAFFGAMLDQVQRTYWRKEPDFVWDRGEERARVQEMPLYQGGHWQVYIELRDFYFWLSDLSEGDGQSIAPRKFANREDAVAAALTSRASLLD